ncbi:hypothetical protein TrispH2_009482 [Trichoplax sp. H2]|nr:hypothetical protein TrispH2_009482 [Trichoplax sp. H2]|eukprot:RDD39514.1 hypothetical protein TrispH2_009482 [Trichoplax sp. H2]
MEGNYRDQSQSEFSPLHNLTETGINFTTVQYLLPGVIISLTALLVDFAVIILILANPRVRKISNSIFCSSCFCGLLSSVQTIAVVLNLLYETDYYFNDFIECFLDETIELSLFAVFNIHVTLINLQRCLSIIFPFKYQRWATRRNVAIAIILAWIVPIGVIFMLSQFISLVTFGNCSEWYQVSSANIIVTRILLPITFVLPPLVTIVTYSIIINKVYSFQKKFRSQCNSTPLPQSSSSHQLMFLHRKALIQMALVLGAYSLSLFPLFTVLTILTISPNFSLYAASEVTYCIAATYIFIHPILVVYFTVDLKAEIKKRLTRY